MFSRIILIALIVIAAANAAFAQKDPVPTGWTDVSACGFSFIVPKELKEQKIASTDACQVTYTSPAINIWFDFGPSDGAVLQQRMGGFKESEITLDAPVGPAS